MGKLIDLTGLRFGRLTAIKKVKRDADTRAYWFCSCDCGSSSVTSGKNLRNGSAKSCGCIAAENASLWMSSDEFSEHRKRGATTHGEKRRNYISSEYKVWLGMKRRCFDKSYKDFSTYGGRGITVCDRWNNSFELFLCDMGRRPSEDHQIDRIDPDKGYYKDNCRWVHRSINAAENRRSNIVVEIDGERFPSLTAACRKYGTNLTAVKYRIDTGIDVDCAVKTPAHELKPRRTRESYLRKGSR